MADPFNILISSSGRRGALVGLCRRTLDEMGLTGRVLAADMTRASAAYQLCDEGFYATRFNDPAFIPEMIKVCQAQSVGLVIPTHDRELMLYAKAVDQFRSIGTHINISSPGVVAIGSDKVETHRWLGEQGFPVPRQATPDEVLASPADWPLPLLIKPRHGSASIGVHTIDDLDKLRLLTADRPYLVQALATGHEYTVDLFADQAGVCRCAVPRRRLETRAGEVSKGVTERNGAVIGLATRVCNALPGVRGLVNLQVFHDPETGGLSVIELNARFGGGYPLTHQAGADCIRWLIEEARGQRSTAASDGWQDGLVMLRYDDAVFVDRDTAGIDH